MERRILHIDMDAFFASVEQARDPSLRGKPVIVGGDKDTRRGVVSTASYEARVFGVHSAMPIAQARKLCPHGVYLRGSWARYQEASNVVRSVLETVSPLVQFASIDEAYVDVSGSQRIFGGDEAIARHVKSEIRRLTDLPSTIAIAPNKLVAKIAANEVKPDGYICVHAGEEETYLRDLPVRRLPGIGPKLGETIEARGIRTIGDLAALPEKALLDLFGPHGIAIQRRARGISSSRVTPHSAPKSISRETTFAEDLTDWGHVERVLVHLMERCAFALREDAMEARTITLKVRDSGFNTHTFSVSLPAPTAVDSIILDALTGLMEKGKRAVHRVRLIGIGLAQLSHDQHQALLFDGEREERWERALHSVDQLRTRHGFDSLRLARSLALDTDGEEPTAR